MIRSVFRLRIAEWATSVLLFGMGLISLFNPAVFTLPGLVVFAPIAVLWTWLTLCVGGARMVALFINGHWRGGTPLIRMVGAILGVGMFGALLGTITVGSMGSVYGINWGTSTYGALMLLEIISVYYAASDVANAHRYGS